MKANARCDQGAADDVEQILNDRGAHLAALLPGIYYCSRGPTPARERSGRGDAASALAAGAPAVFNAGRLVQHLP